MSITDQTSQAELARPDASSWTCWRDASHRVASVPSLGWPQCTECGAAPQYDERAQYLPVGFRLNIYVLSDHPTADWLSQVLAKRTAIVGIPDDSQVYYEGWTNGPAQYGDRDARGLWEAGVEHAASRLITRYPTTAMSAVKPHAVRLVGHFDPRLSNPRFYVSGHPSPGFDIIDPAALDAWLA